MVNLFGKKKEDDVWVTVPIEVRIVDFEAEDSSLDPEKISEESNKITEGKGRFRRDWIEYSISTKENASYCYLYYMGAAFKVLMDEESLKKLLGNR